MLERSELEDAKPRDPRQERLVLTGLTQAALKADAVTSDPNWDTYLSYIQHSLEVAQKLRQAGMDRLASPLMVNQDQIAMLRNQILLCDERIRVLQFVVNMPAEIKRNGHIAKAKLAELDAAQSETENAAAA